MSNPAIRYETSVLYAWTEAGCEGLRGIQLQKNGSLAMVDQHLNIIAPLTNKQAQTLVRSHPKRGNYGGKYGYSGFPPEAGWCLWAKDPNRQL